MKPCITGFSKLTLLDYPGLVAAEIFLSGCNMRCPFCQNAELTADQAAIPDEQIFPYLESRRGMLDGVVVTGGEPTLHDASPLLSRLKAMDYKVKLDTNGLRPDALCDWIDKGLVDYVAMDVKSSPSGYATACGLTSPDTRAIRRSISLIRDSGLPYEFRTTVTPSLHSPDGIGELCRELIPGASAYWLQPFVMWDTVPDRSLAECGETFLRECLTAARVHVPSARVRGKDW